MREGVLWYNYHMKDMNPSEYNPLVSVAMTTSKSERFLRPQIESILNQTYKNLELVISHDECGDNTVAILDEYQAKDSRVRWEYNKKEKGFIKNSENAVSMCKGEILFFADHDDTWYPDRIRTHVEQYKDKAVDWVYDKSVLTNENDEKIGTLEEQVPNYYSKDKLTLLNYAWGTCIGAAHGSYRAHLVHKAMPIPEYAPGHDSWIQLFIYPSNPVFIDKVGIEYRQHAGQQVGWNHKVTLEEFKEKEAKAIAGNLNYLKRLALNPKLALWKRLFFAAAYAAKQFRLLLVRMNLYKLSSFAAQHDSDLVSVRE